MIDDLPALFERAVAEFEARVHAVGSDQWDLPTPDTDWDVRELVNHLLVEALWAPPLLEGRTIAEVGDRFDGDQLGDDPVGAWTAASRAAVAAARAPGALDRTVHVSFGDIPGREYVSQLLCDHVIHAWDLARAVGADEDLDPVLVERVHGYLAPQAGDWRAAGVFGPQVDVPPDAEPQAQLLGLTGRRP
jgi:uncharacterized protein (TIGR03086 family)